MQLKQAIGSYAIVFNAIGGSLENVATGFKTSTKPPELPVDPNKNCQGRRENNQFLFH